MADTKAAASFSEAENIAVASGNYHNLVLKDDGTVWAWGDNTFGQLGNGEFGGYSDIPVQVMGLQDIVKIEAGGTSSIAMNSSGAVSTWGGNSYGQLGQGHTEDMAFPGGVSFYGEDISMSNHAAAIRPYLFNSYYAFGWGNNDQFQLGYYNPYPFTDNIAHITTINVDENYAVSCGTSLTMIMYDNYIDFIGNGNRNAITYNSSNSFSSISAGNKYNIAYRENGDILQWQNTQSLYYPEIIANMSEVSNVNKLKSTIGNTNLALLDNGTIFRFGENSGGTFGNGMPSGATIDPFIRVDGVRFKDISGGYQHVVALADDGTIWGWGTNSNGVLGGFYDGSYYPRELFHPGAQSYLPTSGYEVAYEPERWNDGGAIQYTTNCYAYSVNLQRHPISGAPFPLPIGNYCLQPGELSGQNIDYGIALDPSDEGRTIIGMCKDDADAIYGTFEPIGRFEAAPEGTYKVALVIAPGMDYHWYRQNPDGTWSHKPGQYPVRNTDDFNWYPYGETIIDPLLADRGYYTEFIGYFAVEAKEGGMYEFKSSAQPSRSPAYLPIEIDEQNPAISLEQAAFIVKGMSVADVRQQIGLPQGITGSGILMDSYLLDNGDSLVINYGAARDIVFKVAVISQQGEITFIIE